MQEGFVEATVDIPPVAVKAEIDKPISNPSNCRRIVNFRSESNVTSSNREIREPEMAMDILAISRISSMASDRNLESVKSEPVTSDRDAVHEEESRRYDAFSKLSIFWLLCIFVALDALIVFPCTNFLLSSFFPNTLWLFL